MLHRQLTLQDIALDVLYPSSDFYPFGIRCVVVFFSAANSSLPFLSLCHRQSGTERLRSVRWKKIVRKVESKGYKYITSLHDNEILLKRIAQITYEISYLNLLLVCRLAHIFKCANSTFLWMLNAGRREKKKKMHNNMQNQRAKRHER